ncbi:pyridoxal phosphate-dependent aminotransferase [Alteromonas macleodii]|uniref:pyridoxal phosphate-dependent aminotransferase n=1 Tax=Alteromonas macleodii TaxID=28108 RepID=UPI00207674F5|nr:pyridoxal phosphate-dependent aminotransferase [Alteromonas macleodii]USI28837.1 pyridoxal phosphate-dependent aminotransferase [Alteromonas macleodii]
MKWPADRIAQSSPKSFGMYEKAVSYMEKGIDLIHLGFGKPSFDTPKHIKKACIEALEGGLVHYGDFRGNAGFRQAIVKKLRRDNAMDYSDREVLVTNGLTHGSYGVLMAAIDEGDEVILLDPYYPQYINKIELAGGVVVRAPLDKENNFSINPDLIEAKITDRTKMICLVNPANPTGRVYTRAELQSLADLAIKHNLFVLSDEVYEQICFDGNQHISIATLPGMRERTFTLFAFTKAYAMDGWRVGYLAADEAFIPAIMNIFMNDVVHVNVFVQEGARMALEGSQDCIAEALSEDKRRRDLVVNCLNAMPGVSCTSPNATIYAFPDISATGKSSQQIADELLEQHHVVVETGEFYGDVGAGRIRVCFGAEEYERIAEAMQRMQVYFESLNRNS